MAVAVHLLHEPAIIYLGLSGKLAMSDLDSLVAQTAALGQAAGLTKQRLLVDVSELDSAPPDVDFWKRVMSLKMARSQSNKSRWLALNR